MEVATEQGPLENELKISAELEEIILSGIVACRIVRIRPQKSDERLVTNYHNCTAFGDTHIRARGRRNTLTFMLVHHGTRYHP